MVEIIKRKKAAESDPSKWTEFFAMADHMKEVAPETFEQLNIADIQAEGISACLEGLQQKPLEFVSTALSIEHCSSGALELAKVSTETITAKIQDTLSLANGAKEVADSWLFSFALSQAKGLSKLLKL